MVRGVPSRKGVVFAKIRTVELVRGVIAFRLCGQQWLVRNADAILRTSEKVLGETLTYHTALKWIMFDHFCAGKDEADIKPTLKRLADLGVGPILDYAAEADILGTVEPKADPRENVRAINMTRLLTASMEDLHYTAKQEQLDSDARRYAASIKHASQNVPPAGVTYAAAKLTGLFDVQLLARMTALLLDLRRAWVKICDPSLAPPLEDCRVVLGRIVPAERRYVASADFVRGVMKLNSSVTKTDAEALAKALQHDNRIDYFDYTKQVSAAIFSAESAVSGPQVTMRKLCAVLHPAEYKMLEESMARVRNIAVEAEARDVRLMIDAEQTFYQMAIDQVTRVLQREFNKTAPRIYNTYQCYTTTAEMCLDHDLMRAQREGWCWGGKVVRGAYMVQEREVAALLGYPSPIQPDKAATDACYDRCAKRILDQMAVAGGTPLGVLFGSHNEESVQYIVGLTKALPPNKCSVSVAQLLGMGNHISYPLAAEGFNVFKYVPYGPVKETTAYLLRRAVENSTMLANPTSELKLMEDELRRRFAVPFIVAAAVVLWVVCSTRVCGTVQKHRSG